MYIQFLCIVHNRRKEKLRLLNGQFMSTTPWEQACGWHSVPSSMAFCKCLCQSKCFWFPELAFALVLKQSARCAIYCCFNCTWPFCAGNSQISGSDQATAIFGLPISLQRSESLIQHITTVWTAVFFAGKKLCVDLKNANDEKSTTCQHKLFQWIISALKNVNFIFTYFNELSSLWLYFCSFKLI